MAFSSGSYYPQVSQMCSDTSLSGKSIALSSFFYFLCGGEWEALDATETLCRSSEENMSISEDVSNTSTVLTIIDGVEMSQISKGVVDLGLPLLARGNIGVCVGGTGDLGVMTLSGLSGKSKTLELVFRVHMGWSVR